MMRTKLYTCAFLLATACQLQAAELPQAGMSMHTVEQKFGAPLKKNAPIGHPPITRWEYNGFNVVFERTTVVQSVEVSATANAASNTATNTPAPAPVSHKTAPAQITKPAPATVETSAAPVPAVVATPSNNAPEVDTAEQQRRANERAAMAKAAAEANAAQAAQAATPAATTPAPTTESTDSSTPATTASPTVSPDTVPEKPKSDGSYTFDPVTGRVIIK
jgi:hypothetical protein